MSDTEASSIAAHGSLRGKRLYSPGILAGYTILASFSLGFLLYGLNLRRRGLRIYGSAAILFAVLAALPRLSGASNHGPAGMQLALSLMCGLGIYKQEIGPYQAALSAGAIPAPWWPPALFLIVGVAALIGLEWLCLT